MIREKREKRNQEIKIRVTAKEKKQLQSIALEEGLPLTVYIRQSALHPNHIHMLDTLQQKTEIYNMMQGMIQDYPDNTSLTASLELLYKKISGL